MVCVNDVSRASSYSDNVIDAISRVVLEEKSYYTTEGECKEFGSGSISVMVAILLIALLF